MANSLQLPDYRRYARQMIIDEIGLPGQLKLRNAAVAVVGAGGLGCSALQYLVAAGIDCIGIIDHDVVDISNLQRQTLYKESMVGRPKAECAASALKGIDIRARINVITEALVSTNARALLTPYDLILDCTDNPATRYLLSDTAVLLGKPLISGAAQRFDGQLCTYNLGPEGPCYRCLFPKPPSREAAPPCEETGIMGPVTGVIGSLQALEAIKIIVGLQDGPPSLLVYSGLGTPPFRSIRLRKRRASCPACGTEGQKVGQIEDIDYVQFCGGESPDWESIGREPGSAGTRLTANELWDIVERNPESVRIIDVRPKTEFGICHLPWSINVPFQDIVANPADHLSAPETYVVCRMGVNSQIAAEAMRSVRRDTTFVIKDLVGGLRSWSRDIDPQFPIIY